MNKNFALLVCDIQSKTSKNIFNKNGVIYNINKLLYMKQYIPEIKFAAMSEFIPEKLGYIDPSINPNYIDLIYRKTRYTMVNKELLDNLYKHKISDIILTGMETQWCINKTTSDLSSLFNIYIPVDAVGNSKSNEENIYNFHSLSNNGAIITTTDFMLCSFMDEFNDNISKKYLEILKTENQRV